MLVELRRVVRRAVATAEVEETQAGALLAAVARASARWTVLELTREVTDRVEGRSDVTRYGLFVSFSVGWGRQEENHYLELPLEEALALPQEMRELIGYRMHTGLGFSEHAPSGRQTPAKRKYVEGRRLGEWRRGESNTRRRVS